MVELRKLALENLVISDSEKKCKATSSVNPNSVLLDTKQIFSEPSSLPGRLTKPDLVHPSLVKQRSVQSTEGRAALLHSLAHIEINAVNLALDIVWRFPAMPESFYLEWYGVAVEEASHYQLLAAHLQSLGFQYGDFPAHDGLWLMAEKTKNDVLARLGLVPRTLEARGLDASPLVRNKLLSVGDKRGAEIIDIILRDEIGHVALGNKWYRWVCDRNGLDHVTAYEELAHQYQAPLPREPFNLDARRLAGFDELELAALKRMANIKEGF
jgi:uncharacterized ferritin-like protein (DUF455 family)